MHKSCRVVTVYCLVSDSATALNAPKAKSFLVLLRAGKLHNELLINLRPPQVLSGSVPPSQETGARRPSTQDHEFLARFLSYRPRHYERAASKVDLALVENLPPCIRYHSGARQYPASRKPPQVPSPSGRQEDNIRKTLAAWKTCCVLLQNTCISRHNCPIQALAEERHTRLLRIGPSSQAGPSTLTNPSPHIRKPFSNLNPKN